MLPLKILLLCAVGSRLCCCARHSTFNDFCWDVLPVRLAGGLLDVEQLEQQEVGEQSLCRRWNSACLVYTCKSSDWARKGLGVSKLATRKNLGEDGCVD